MRAFISGRAMAGAAVAMVLLAAAPILAQTDYRWINAGGGVFGDADNWDPLDPPGPPAGADAAIFDLPDAYSVTFGQDHTNLRLAIDDGQVDFDLGGWVYALEHGGGGGDASVIIGRWAGLDPSLTLSAGTVQAEACTLGVVSGGSGTLTLDGAGTTLINHGDFNIGAMGAGHAAFLNGACVNSHANVLIGTETDGTDSGLGEVNLSGQEGQHTTWTIGDDSVYASDLWVGLGGQGTINVNSHATVTMKEHVVDDQGNRSSGWVLLGAQAGSAGDVNVSGEQARFDVEHSPVTVGDYGSGSLTVLAGGQMWMGDGEMWVAAQPGSVGSVQVSGTDSVLDENSPYISVVGLGGQGTLTVNDFGLARFSHLIVGQADGSEGYVFMASNGTVVSGYTSLGDQAGSYGEANIDQEAVWTVTDWMNVGREGTAGLYIWGGGRLDQTCGGTFALVLGTEPGSQGTVTLEDHDTRLDTAGELVIGQSGAAFMYVYSGAQVTASQAHLATFAGSEGWLTVSGHDAGFHTTAGGLLVGREGEGHLLVDGLGAISLPGRLDIGEQPGSVGWADVGSEGLLECDGVWVGIWGGQDGVPAAEGYLSLWGPGARLTSTAQIIVGREGHGELNLYDTAELVTAKSGSPTDTSGVLGAMASGIGVATVNNASWTQDGALVVGWSGTGTLNVEDWGFVESAGGAIGRMVGGEGTVTVAGDHAVWNIWEDLSVGGTMDEAGGTGVLSVNGPEGHVRIGCGGSGGTLRVWEGGLVSLNDGRAVVGSDVLPEPGALWIAPMGVVDLRGGTVETSVMYVDGLLSGHGSIVGDVFVDPDTGSGPGVLAPGESPGIITLTGDLMLEGLAQFDITGHDVGQYDLVQQGADACAVTFGGALELRFEGDYAEGGQWVIFDFDQYGGDFAGVAWTGLPFEQAARFDPLTGIVEIIVEPATTGDFNRDGCVDGADYTIWADHYNHPGGPTEGDASGDHFVDGADYTVWADHYDPDCGPASVPEPVTLALMLVGGAALLRRR